MRLLIVRHAIAVPRGTPGLADGERPLTRRGRDRFRRAARGLATLLPAPDVLLASPLARAWETAQILAAAWGRLRPTRADALAGGDLRALARALDAHRGRGLVAIVGHEPHLSQALAQLLGARHGGPFEFRKGGVALVELRASFKDGASLSWFLPPRLLRRLGRDAAR